MSLPQIVTSQPVPASHPLVYQNKHEKDSPLSAAAEMMERVQRKHGHQSVVDTVM